jgi:hypothetical protein
VSRAVVSKWTTHGPDELVSTTVDVDDVRLNVISG